MTKLDKWKDGDDLFLKTEHGVVKLPSFEDFESSEDVYIDYGNIRVDLYTVATISTDVAHANIFIDKLKPLEYSYVEVKPNYTENTSYCFWDNINYFNKTLSPEEIKETNFELKSKNLFAYGFVKAINKEVINLLKQKS